MKTNKMIKGFFKNVLMFGSLFIILSLMMDWYRQPSAPPQFSQHVNYDLQGEPHILAQSSHQKPMLLYFWGSWCHFCQFTSPAVQQLAEEGVPVLSVALRSGSAEEVKEYLAEQGYTFPVINDPTGDYAKQWDIQATPTLLIIKSGNIVNHTTGWTSYWGIKTRLWLAQFSR